MIYPILLCGGSGTRLWPLSRQSYPKQFSKMVGNDSLFLNTAKRLSGDFFAAPIVLTSSDFRFIVAEQLIDAGIDPDIIMIEPARKNTAPAILAAAIWLEQKDPDAMMLVAPTDHVVPNTEAFHATIQSGITAALAGDLVTLGVTPDRAETGYGYLELGNTTDYGTIKVKRFVEKPDLITAKKMVATGGFLWNAGLFLFSAGSIIKAFESYAPDLVLPVQKAVKYSMQNSNVLTLDANSWSQARQVSIDCAIMEKADNVSVIPFDSSWSDLGGWDAVWREAESTNLGVALSGNAASIDCKNTLLRSESSSLEIVGIGLENIMAIAMPDAVLVANMDHAQEVGKAVLALQKKGTKQATQFPRMHRPWGWFEVLVAGDQFQVKRIVVHPGAALSLQSHAHRCEHWVVVKGTALATLEGVETSLTENQSIYIPTGATHRLENLQDNELILIEVQIGSYLGDDDITRYKDRYARV